MIDKIRILIDEMVIGYWLLVVGYWLLVIGRNSALLNLASLNNQ